MTDPVSAIRSLPRFAYLSPAEAREVVLAVLGAVRDMPPVAIKAAWVAMNETPSGTWKRMKAEKMPPRELFAAKMGPRWAAAIDALVAEVQGRGAVKRRYCVMGG